MWEKLLNLFKSQIPENEIDEQELISPEIESTSSSMPEVEAPPTMKSHVNGSYNGPGRLIGFNYLKRRDENEESPRKFINLGKLLRGNYK